MTEPRDSSMWKESSGSEAIEACDELLSRRAEGPRPAESGAGASSSEELKSKALTFSRPAERATAAPWKKLPTVRAGAAAEGPGPAAPCLWVGGAAAPEVGTAAAPEVGRATAGAAGAAAGMAGVRVLRAAIRAGSTLAAMGAIRAGSVLLGAILCGMAVLPALAAGAGSGAKAFSRAIRSLFSWRSLSSSDCMAGELFALGARSATVCSAGEQVPADAANTRASRPVRWLSPAELRCSSSPRNELCGCGVQASAAGNLVGRNRRASGAARCASSPAPSGSRRRRRKRT